MLKQKANFFPLIGIAAVLILNGCSNSASVQNPPQSQTEVTASQEPSANEPASGEPAVTTTYPIVTDGSITLKYWTPINGGASKFIESYNDNPAYQKMQEDTGVNIEFMHPVVGQEQEQLNLLIVSREYPDLLGMASKYKGGEFQGMYDGIFVELTDVIEELAPDYYGHIQNDKEFFRQISDNDGRIAAFCAYKPDFDPPAIRIVARQDVLNELNSSIPETISDYEELFTKMLDAGITPYMLSGNGYEAQFIGAFGIHAGTGNSAFWKNTEGKVQYGQIMPEFKEYLTLMNDWYNKGYLSKDFTSVNGTQTNTLFDTKGIGMYSSAVVATYNRGQTQGFDVVPFPYPRKNKGDVLHYLDGDIWPRWTQDPCTVAVTSASSHIDEAIQFLNYGYTDEGFELLNWGVEGLNWDWVDGERVYNDLMLNNPQFGTEEASYIYKAHFSPKWTGAAVNVHANLLKSPGSLAVRMMYSDDPNQDSAFNMPPVQLNTDALSRRTSIMSDINTYADEMVLKFIIGAESLDKFDEFVAVIEGMGIYEAIELTQEAYDAYLNK